MRPLYVLQVSALVLGEWLVVTPPGNGVTRPQNEWHQEQSFDTLEQCARYRGRQADEIKECKQYLKGRPLTKFTSLLQRAIYW